MNIVKRFTSYTMKIDGHNTNADTHPLVREGVPYILTPLIVRNKHLKKNMVIVLQGARCHDILTD